MWYSSYHCAVRNHTLNSFLFLCSDSKKITFITLYREFLLPIEFFSESLPRAFPHRKNTSPISFQQHNSSSSCIVWLNPMQNAIVVAVRAWLYSHIHVTVYVGSHIALGKLLREPMQGYIHVTKQPSHPPLQYARYFQSLCNLYSSFVNFFT